MAIHAGQPAPDFTLPDETGRSHTLSEYRGKPVVLFFYPEDDTPGCTTEVCNFRDDYSAYEQYDVQLLGVSPDDEESHEAFKSKFNLPFPLLADVGHKVCDLYEVWGEKVMFGFRYEGVRRSTFVIDPEGTIIKTYAQVGVEKHSQEVLDLLAEHFAKSA